MELTGEAYFLNLSLVAIGFASVSALVMLLRQMMGGGLSKFDIHLITSYLSGAFAAGMAAIMPVLLALGSNSAELVWGVSGALGFLFVETHLFTMLRRRRRTAGTVLPPILILDYALQGLSGLAMLVNAAAPRSAFIYAAAATLLLGLVMLAFVRRVASLLANKDGAGGDWDPHRG